MKEKHLDINGKNIRIDDIVIVHKIEKYRPTYETYKSSSNSDGIKVTKKDYNDFMKTIDSMCGCLGIVSEFGCVLVEMYRPDFHQNEDRAPSSQVPCMDEEVEVVGNVR